MKIKKIKYLGSPANLENV